MNNLKEVIIQNVWDSKALGFALMIGTGALLWIQRAEGATYDDRDSIGNRLGRLAGGFLGTVGRIIPERQQSSNDA